MKKLDRSLLKRDIQGLMSYAIAINDSNEDEQLDKLLSQVHNVHEKIFNNHYHI